MIDDAYMRRLESTQWPNYFRKTWH